MVLLLFIAFVLVLIAVPLRRLLMKIYVLRLQKYHRVPFTCYANTGCVFHLKHKAIKQKVIGKRSTGIFLTYRVFTWDVSVTFQQATMAYRDYKKWGSP